MRTFGSYTLVLNSAITPRVLGGTVGAMIPLYQSLRQCPSLEQAFIPPQDLAETLECQGCVMQTTARNESPVVASECRVLRERSFKQVWNFKLQKQLPRLGRLPSG